MNKDKAIELINNNKASFIIYNKDYYDIGIGVKPIIKIIDTNKLLLDNAYIVDKIVGKASAMLFVKYNIKYIHGILMSKQAINVLEYHNIEYTYDNICEYIVNRTNIGLCPLEDCVKNIDINDINNAEINIRNRIRELMNNEL